MHLAVSPYLCQMKYDVIIAGAGIVGLSTALQLQRKKPGLKIAVLEKEHTVAQHQSSHNSGVIHSGIYYKPGSQRALNCQQGYRQLIQFCQENDLTHEICGKIIVAVEASEMAFLKKIYQRGLENGLDGIRKISAAEAREIEPYVNCVAGVWVPQAGIVDYGAVAGKYAEIFQKNGGEILVNQKVTDLHSGEYSLSVVTDNSVSSTHETAVFVNCGGLYSDRLAQLTGAGHDLQILPFRGEYFHLKPEAEHLVSNLIYPVPNPNFPFLGVHFTRMIQGGIEAGPNAVLAFRREGYSRWQLDFAELAETLAFPGFRKIARKYWRDGWAEMKRSYHKPSFVKALQRMVPDIRPEWLTPGRAGVRAMACDQAGNLLDDFLILSKPRVINVCNAPSPAATASLAIGETIAHKVLEQC